MTGHVRRSIISGSWYPGEPAQLRNTINGYLDNASIPDIPKKPLAIISPHAGYAYSGGVAAYAYKAVSSYEYSSVVVISPSHISSSPFVSVWPCGVFQTPLGYVDIDELLCSDIQSDHEIIKDDEGPHHGEHAIEIQLPFLQVAMESFKLCPLIMGRQDIDLCERLAKLLSSKIEKPEDVLIVASSDLSHFHNAGQAESMDKKIAKRINDFDIYGLSRDLESSESEACGGGPILTALLYAKEMSGQTAQVLKYAHSGYITNETSSVVGYLSAVVY